MRRIEWIGAFAQSLLSLGLAYLFFRMIDGSNHHPVLAMPMAGRILVVLLVAAAGATFRVWLTARLQQRRQQAQ